MPQVYEEKHKGCAIVCGAAPCLFEDLEEAKKARPDATVLGVKFISALLPEVEHVWTQHIEFARRIKEKAGRPIKLHARPKEYQIKSAGIWFYAAPEDDVKAIDYVWPSLHWVAGSSGIAAALWARHGLGFDEVIMAGVPLNRNERSYITGYGQEAKFENKTFAHEHQVDHWHNLLKKHIANGKTAGIYSMSGSTRNMLGEPPKVEIQ